MAYPYSARETFADGTIHVAGISAALSGMVILILFAAQHLDPAQVTALSIYAGVVVFSFMASALYHLSPFDSTRPLLLRIDHAAIYLKIAGTYTPLVILIGGMFAYGLLAVIWVLALAGALMRLFVWEGPANASMAIYLAMGWAAVLLIWPLATTVPVVSFLLIVVGGLLYSIGCVFFSWDGLRYQNAVWHGFVLTASTCFFAAISLAAFA